MFSAVILVDVCMVGYELRKKGLNYCKTRYLRIKKPGKERKIMDSCKTETCGYPYFCSHFHFRKC